MEMAHSLRMMALHRPRHAPISDYGTGRFARPVERLAGLPDARAAAEKAFKAVTTKPVEGPPRALPAALPSVKETVTLRVDRDVLDFFQQDGPGWQDRINAALRKAAGK